MSAGLKQKWVDDTKKRSLIERLKYSRLIQAVWNVMVNTPIEIAIGALVIGAVAGNIGYQMQAVKEGQVPVAYSEIETLQKQAADKNQVVPPLTMFYSATNDSVMKVFEANNEAYKGGYDHKAFAEALQKRVDREKSEHALISDYAARMKDYAKDAFQSLAKPLDAAPRLERAGQSLSDAWQAQHDDEYHTILVPMTVSDGKNTTTVYVPQQVYDYTIHTYTYNPGAGTGAAKAFNELAARAPNVDLKENLRQAQETHDPNRQAMRDSMVGFFKDKDASEADYLELANRWATGSAFTVYYGDVRTSYNAAMNCGRIWQTDCRTARSQSYKTYSPRDSGPREYQTAQSGIESVNGMIGSLNKITDGMRLSADQIPQMDAKIKDYIGVVLQGQAGDAGALRSDIMSTARKVYDANFPGGFDVSPFKWGWVAFAAGLGTLAGAGLGTGVDRYVVNYARRRRPEKPESLKSAPVWRRV